MDLKRYHFVATDRPMVEDDSNGPWVYFTDAEAYGRAQYDEGVKAGCREYAALHESETREAVKREREEIIAELQDAKFETVEPWLASRTAREVFNSVLSRIRSRGDCEECGCGYGVHTTRCSHAGPDPKLKKLPTNGVRGTSDTIRDKINEIIDAIESLRRGRA